MSGGWAVYGSWILVTSWQACLRNAELVPSRAPWLVQSKHSHSLGTSTSRSGSETDPEDAIGPIGLLPSFCKSAKGFQHMHCMLCRNHDTICDIPVNFGNL